MRVFQWGADGDGASNGPRTAVVNDAFLRSLEAAIDRDHVQFLDFLNGELHSPYASVFGGSLANLSEPFDPVAVWRRIHQYALLLPPADYIFTAAESDSTVDFLQLNRRVRAILIAHTVLCIRPELQTLLVGGRARSYLSSPPALRQLRFELNHVLEILQETVYPWLSPRYTSIQDIYSNLSKGPLLQDAGIVFSFGKNQIQFGVLAVANLNLLVLIKIHYVGDNDLPPQIVNALKQAFQDIEFIDLMNQFPSELFQFDSWSVKPFALLASRFTRPIFVDADVLFLQNPEIVILSESALFQEFGQLFFHDRTIEREDGSYAVWFKSIHPFLSNQALHMRFVHGISRHEQEAGVVAIDKSDHRIFHSLLYACKMNSNQVRPDLYNIVWGDKETFWMSMEFLRVPYAFSPTYAGAIGFLDNGRVCGSMFHVDEFLRPFWWNGGVLRMKRQSNDLFMSYDYAAFDIGAGGDVWDWEDEEQRVPFCFHPTMPENEVFKVEGRHRALIEEYMSMYSQIRDSGWEEFLVTIGNVGKFEDSSPVVERRARKI
ncbi:hypothetical protein HDU82_006465 [Entophlyctis luteolus]|nr:hypothetical protein HDU82_006465 [Entophlyctis luteolus]